FTVKRKAPRRGKSSRRQGANTGEELFAVPVEELPRNLDGLDRGELRARESRVDRREGHAAAATTPDQHSRHRWPHAGDALRVRKNEGHCGSRHHGTRQSNACASAAPSGKSGT